MADFPNSMTLPLHITPFSGYSIGPMFRVATANTSSPATNFTPVADQAYFIPFTIPWPYPVARVFWCNGGTITSSHADFGIYSTHGGRIFSVGATALSGTSAPQYSTGGFTLNPGSYYMAYVCDGTQTSRGFGLSSSSALISQWIGMYTMATAYPLPAVATFTRPAATEMIPLMGITRTASGF